MWRFGETKIVKQEFYGAKKKEKKKKTMKIWDVDVNKIVISKLVETKINSTYLIGYLDKVINCLECVDMLTHLKLKMEIKIRTIN